MKYASYFSYVLAAASLLACGNPEDAPAPATPPPASEAPPASPAPAAMPEHALATEQPAAPQPEVAPTAPAAAAAEAKSVHEAAPSAAKPDLTHGQQIYRQACAFCHDKGVAGAPKTGDAAAWSPRLAQGMDTLYASALRGKGAMPAKGGNPSLVDADVKAAVDYLAAQAH
jgi:cytochrome c5